MPAEADIHAYVPALLATARQMMQDHERGRLLELAAIGDAGVELGECYALPMAA